MTGSSPSWSSQQPRWVSRGWTRVSLQLLYLIFRPVLGLVLQLGRTSASKDISKCLEPETSLRQPLLGEMAPLRAPSYWSAAAPAKTCSTCASG
jgi:hypothetical protein